MSRGVKRADVEEEAGSEENNSLTPQPIDEHSTRSAKRTRLESPSIEHYTDGKLSDPAQNGAEAHSESASQADETTSQEDETNAGVERISSDEGKTAEMGVIEKIDLTNFMCHNRLVIDLGPRLNFVIGHNGSGKSAILTAITLALGAKATTTSRGTSIKSFVKEGKPAAVVEIVLRNRGSDAYRHDVYKDKIIIERIIKTDGSGSWKIKNQDGKVISMRREELNAICDHANIQVENPMNILTQDSARQFLSSSSPSEMYQFFLRGTQLSQLAAEYDVVEADILKISETLQRKKEDIKDFEVKAREAQERFNVIVAAQQQRLQLEDTRKMAAWAYVASSENEVVEQQTRVEKFILKREKLQEEIKRQEEIIGICENKITGLEQDASDAQDREKPLLDELTSIRASLKEHAARMKAIRDEENALSGQYNRLSSQNRDIDKRVEREHQRASGHDSRRATLISQRKQAELEFKKLERDLLDARDRTDEIDGEVEKLEQRKDELVSQREATRDRVAATETLVRNLRAAKSNRLSAYGQNIPLLAQKIQQQQGWKGPVVGPIGSHIKMKDPKWAPVLESVIGNTLGAFCVTNHNDRVLLQRLQKEARCEEVPILTAPDEAFDYSSGEPAADVLTILRVLDVDNHFVKRQLINAAHIERSVLVEERQLGDQLLRARPHNVKVCFSLDLFRVTGGDGGSSTQTLQPYKGPPRLSSDVDAKLADASRRLSLDETELQSVFEQLNNVKRDLQSLSDERRGLRQQGTVLQRKAREKHGEMEKIDDELSENQSTNVAALVEARKEVEAEQAKISESFRQLSNQTEEEEARGAPLIQKRGQLQEQLQMMQEESANLKPRLQAAAEKRLAAIQATRHYRTQYDGLGSKLEDANNRARVLERALKEDEERAAEFGERVETTETPQEYQKQIVALETQIRLANQQQGVDITVVRAEMEQTLTTFLQAKDDIDHFELAQRYMRSALNLRLEKWLYFRKHIAMRARALFQYYLQTRGYDGSLHFNHDRGRLTLSVKTDSAHGAHGKKDPRSLSGGEKSYSTICLLLALWEAIGCPIRALDEFDVFMDAVNRRMSMRLIMNVAKRSNHTQFILITPQNMNNVSIGPEVRVHRLADPQRNQTTLS